ncbi:formyltetrahydrofolate deformylase [Spiribacter sp. C176]|uniref:Formyltetrahydrofolate deformylase n=1 Tax=Spiribacter salilacus TaxID=2664894 RepID=A0A6N7QMW4_9GAMM|nr:formyltetrahydrofolate deformylase [Spiribacter salilacus]MRH77865.1 formyltetrahydrofolate deformylase [Spiribacter salilacus]
MTTATLLMHCKDQQGLVAKVTRFIAENGGNVIDLEQHVDRAEGMFFMRVNWELNGFALSPDEIGPAFESQIAEPSGMSWQLHQHSARPRVAIFVSKLAHCFHDLLARWQSDEWDIDIPLIISNHEDMRPVAEQFGLPYFCFPITAENKIEQEAKELELLAEHDVDLIVLARYMQVISPQMIEAYPERIINIHHSFLPAFAGAKPYHAAHARGVKVIGATSHYVTAELDAGPIIEQDVTPISHRDSIETLVRKGRDLEKLVLARGVLAHLQRKTLVYRNRTIVFS